MKPLGVLHVALLVNDLEASRRFYGEGLGFAEIARPAFGDEGAWFQVGDQQVHLTVTDQPLARSVQHFAVHVRDLDEAVAELEAKAIKVHRVPPQPTPNRQAVVWDPSGNLIELNQPG
jgi:catechol 2,3-dioxygenase-like lactoylglutathione lyase family enzyme